MIQFLPLEERTIQSDGLSIFYLRYWHPIFAAWRETRRKVLVRYHPEDLSRVFVSADGKTYVEATFADLGRPPISLSEQRLARKALRSAGSPVINEALIFRTIEQQRQIVARAATQTRRAKRSGPKVARSDRPLSPWPTIRNQPPTEPSVDSSKEPEETHAEIW